MGTYRPVTSTRSALIQQLTSEPSSSGVGGTPQNPTTNPSLVPCAEIIVGSLTIPA